MAGTVQAPEKELRFTRSGQAVIFWMAAAVLVACGVTMLATGYYRDVNPEMWLLVSAGMTFAFAGLMVQTAVRLTRHAYLILTPLGIEIFPFFRPADGMRLVMWQEIQGAEVDEGMKRLTLHHDVERTSGIYLSLAPIREDRRRLLAKAVIGRVTPPDNNG